MSSIQESLGPISSAAVDPRLAPHLESGETVLWQNQPRQGSFFGPGQILTSVGLIALGLILASGIVGPQLPELSRYVPAAAASGTGLFLLITNWNRRATLWAYAITDRRLLSVLKDKVVRSLTPGELDRFELRIKRDTVYWLKLANHNRSSNSGHGTSRGPDGVLVGFHGQGDAQATRSLIETWRQAYSDRASASAAAFVDTMSAAKANAQADGRTAPPPGVLRVNHSQTGLTLDVLPDWKVTVKSRQDGPLRLFGVQVLPRIIRDGPEHPYSESVGSWNYLSVRGAPEAGLELTILDRPLDITLEKILNDPLSDVVGTKVLSSTPDLQIGPFRGFSVVRRMPGKEVRSVEALSAPSMLRQVWLARGDMHLELRGYALENQPDVQNAIDAMVDSLGMQS